MQFFHVRKCFTTNQDSGGFFFLNRKVAVIAYSEWWVTKAEAHREGKGGKEENA